MYSLLQDSGLNVDQVENFSSLPLVTFKRESDFEKAPYFLSNLIHNRFRVKKVTEFIDDFLIEIEITPWSKTKFNPNSRMKGPFQCDSLVLSDTNNPIAGIYAPKPTNQEILVSFFNLQAWIKKADLNIWEKKVEHFRVHVNSCMSECCFDQAKKEELTINQKLTKVLDAFEPAATLLVKTKAIANKSFQLNQTNDQVFSKNRDKAEVCHE